MFTFLSSIDILIEEIDSMKSWIIFLVGSIISFNSLAQSNVTENLTLVSEIKQNVDPLARNTQLIWQYNKICEALARHKDPRTEVYLDTLETMARASNWDMAMGLYFRAMGRYHDFADDYQPVLEYYQQALDELKYAKGDGKELAFTYVLKGFFLSNSELHQECWKTLEEGLSYARKAKSKNSLCLMLDWFGDYYYFGLDGEIDNKKALDYYLQVNRILPQIS
ncbi:MAG: tetratricopeptide (TPR) repeat protein [Saprospiraceae bacterium]|jgi:tetratricopeptide (TPR) repeat protein